MPSYPNVRVVGMHFRGDLAKEIASALSPGDTLTIERDPENQFDANAIKVIHPGTGEFIGFIEATQAVWIASEIDELESFSDIGDGQGDVPNINSVTCIVTGTITARNTTYPVVTVEIA